MPSLEKSMEKRSSLSSAIGKDFHPNSPSSKSKSSSLSSPKSKSSSSPSKKSSKSPRRSPRSDASRASNTSGGNGRSNRHGSPARVRRSSTTSQSSANSRGSDKASNNSRMVRSKRRSSTSSGTAARSPVTRRSSLDATHESRTGKASKRPQVSSFLRNTHKDLKEEIAKIQKQIKFLQNLATMSEAKKVDLLFNTIDQDKGGTVDAEELAQAMRQNDELSFRDSLNKAIDMVATFDDNGDGELDLQEFRNYATKAAEQLDLPCTDFCDYIIVQLLLTDGQEGEDSEKEAIERAKIKEEVKKRGELFGVLNDQSLVALFDMFEKNKNDEAHFQSVAGPLYQCAVEFAKDAGTEETLELLLMVDKNDDRTMDYNNFGRLMITISKATQTPLEDIAESLVEAVERQETASTMPDSPYIMLDGVSTVGSDEKEDEIDRLTYGRLKKLFHIWDKDGDGDISASELAEGLKKFQEASGISGDAEEMAQALITFDIDGDNQLDPHEFSRAMIQYAKAFRVELHLLIDMMCLTAKSKEKEEEDFDFGDFNKSFAFSTCDFESQDDGFFDSDDVDFWQ